MYGWDSEVYLYQMVCLAFLYRGVCLLIFLPADWTKYFGSSTRDMCMEVLVNLSHSLGIRRMQAFVEFQCLSYYFGLFIFEMICENFLSTSLRLRNEKGLT